MNHTSHLRSATVLALVALMLVWPAASYAQAGGGPATRANLQLPATGTFTDAAGLGTFEGTFTLLRFAVEDGQLVAVGNLVGTLTDAAGNVIANILRTVSIPILGDATNATCEILHLELGPLDLDLLGLVVHLDRIVLDISAEPGAGNLLGNLLCAVAGLLDGGGPLAGILSLLNNILRNL